METKPQASTRPSVGATLLLLVGVVPFMAGLFGLYHVLGVGLPVFGLLFLVYWAAILRQDPKAFLPTVLGALSGIILGWLLVGKPPLPEPAGMIIAFAALVAALFCFMRGQANLLVNNATMLFLTVATVSEMKVADNVVAMAESLLLAASYMGVISVVAHAVTKRFFAKGGAVRG
ncbi:hypothetical protein LJR225_003428 [Phenylobacterium sp. LjRoot225]|uniref:hypothetical protein n=1 Tax=Phenylobacterium sp. LjRoot225 TaxID=3342285 RepID=UPI003ECEA96A